MILNMRSMSYLYLHPLPQTARVRNPFPFIHKPNTPDGDRIVVPAGWDRQDCGIVRRLRRESVRRGIGTRSVVRGQNRLGQRLRRVKMYVSLVNDQGLKYVLNPPDS